jgi:hypothetical protein
MKKHCAINCFKVALDSRHGAVERSRTNSAFQQLRARRDNSGPFEAQKGLFRGKSSLSSHASRMAGWSKTLCREHRPMPERRFPPPLLARHLSVTAASTMPGQALLFGAEEDLVDQRRLVIWQSKRPQEIDQLKVFLNRAAERSVQLFIETLVTERACHRRQPVPKCVCAAMIWESSIPS